MPGMFHATDNGPYSGPIFGFQKFRVPGKIQSLRFSTKIMTDKDAALTARALFCRSVHAGSMQQACREMGVDRAQARGMLRSLERELGVQLLQRSPAGVKPTSQGSRFYQRWQPALAAIEALTPQGGATGPARINVSLPTTTGTTLLMPVIARYAARHADVRIDARFTHGPFHPLWDGVDLRIGHGQYRLEDVETYPLGGVVRVAVATGRYLQAHDGVARPEDLCRLAVFGARDAVENKKITLTHGRKTATILFDPQVTVRNHIASLSAALSHQGIAVLVPLYLARPYLADGRLVRLLPQWHFPSLQLMAFTGRGACKGHIAGLIEAFRALFADSGDLEAA